MNFYNDIDKNVCYWLEELMKSGQIPPGHIENKSIADIRPEDIEKYTQCHWFCGIAGWPLALRLAQWPEDKPVWTASLPCQPFSTAGKQKGVKDERHLWPVFFRLMQEIKPKYCFGEQVQAAIGLGWLDGIFSDMERENYTCGAIVLPACSIGAPHIRQRLFWVAHAEMSFGGRTKGESNEGGRVKEVGRSGSFGGVADSIEPGLQGHAGNEPERNEPGRIETDEARPTSEGSGDSGVEIAQSLRWRGRGDEIHAGENRTLQTPGSCSLGWSEYILIPCADGKQRRIKPSIMPLVNGLPRGVVPSSDISLSEAENTGEARVMRIKGYGNSVVPILTATFIKSFMEIQNGK